MRVVAGRYGGRRLTAPPGTGTRPTSDRVREALFSALGDLEGARVLDLFAGSGALGIESLSRGAAAALFVERDRGALNALRSNLQSLHVAPADAVVRAGDARAVLRDLEKGAYDLAFLDPPYRLAAQFGGEVWEALAAVLAPGARVVAESDRRNPLEIPGLDIVFERRYGDTLLRILTA